MDTLVTKIIPNGFAAATFVYGTFYLVAAGCNPPNKSFRKADWLT
jgi:hypothetical protein